MQVYSLFQNEITCKRIEVELHTRFQIPSFNILGLPTPEIQEARERIMSAFSAVGLGFPKKKVMVNLTPSSERKTGTGHDLAIALKIMEQVLELKWPKAVYAWGELGLDGKIKPCGSLAKWVDLLLQEKIEILILCREDKARLLALLQWRFENQLSVPENLKLLELNSLADAEECLMNQTTASLMFHKLKSELLLPPVQGRTLLPLSPFLERAIKIAMVGKHHLLILGPKGMGKSQALEWIGALSPRPDPFKTWERVLHADSYQDPASFDTPIRRVHANLRPSHLLGSWNTRGFQPGELARAHGGILIADEFLEWPRDGKECLREPLEQKKYSLSRKQGTVALSCDLQFVGTGNLCPCGGLPPAFHSLSMSKKKQNIPCRCRAAEVQHYLAKLSGPVADRIDLILIHAESRAWEGKVSGQNTLSDLKQSISTSRQFCYDQFGALPSELTVSWLEENFLADRRPEFTSIKNLLDATPSLRSRHKILRLSKSIQALELSPTLKPEHVLEASSFRFEGLP